MNFLSNFFQDNQIGLKASMRGSDFIFNSIQLLCYKYHKINSKHNGLYVDSLDWIKKEKAMINPKSNAICNNN